MSTIKVVKSELASESSNLSSKVSTLLGNQSSIISSLKSVSDYDGINVSSAAKTLASNIKNALSDVDTASKNIKNYSDAINNADIKGKDGKSVDKIEFTYEVNTDGSREGNIIAIWNYFKNKGLSDAAICGILGNISAECGFNPAAIESNGEGHGLIQWSFGRRTALLNAARAQNVDWRDLNFQLDYLWNESVNPNSDYGRRLAAAGFYDPNVSISKAAYEFHRIVEGSNDTESMIQNNRVAVAQNLYNQYKNVITRGTNSTITSDGIKAMSQIENLYSKTGAEETGSDVTNSGTVSRYTNRTANITGGYTSSGGYSGSAKSGGSGGYSTSSALISGSGTPLGEIVNIGGDIDTQNGVIDTSKPMGTGTKYEISDEGLKYLAFIAYREQGSIEGAKLEISLIVNLFESPAYKGKYPDIVSFVKQSGWFGTAKQNYNYPGDDYYNVAESIIRNGDRYLPSNVVEHDCLSDITSISTGSVNNRSDYIPGKTIINNRYGAKYVFVGFAPNGGDPFGYLA